MNRDYVMVPVHVSKLGAVFAMLAGTSPVAVATGNVAAAESHRSEPSPSASTVGTESTNAAPASSEAPNENAGKTDAAGTVFDPARHTGSIVKSGLWRMKAGIARGPGEGEDSPTYVNPNGGSVSTSTPAATPTPALVEEDDEFAAFRAAATPAATAPAARSWTDADLSKLCNQAAVAKGSPDSVKALIAKYLPAGTAAPHSRMIPAETREAFAVEVEAVHGIKYEG